MDRRPPGVSALLAPRTRGRLDRVGQQQRTHQQESTFSFLKTRSVLYLFPSPDQAAGQRSMTKENGGSASQTLGWPGGGQKIFTPNRRNPLKSHDSKK
jgi:hypothetical protein